MESVSMSSRPGCNNGVSAVWLVMFAVCVFLVGCPFLEDREHNAGDTQTILLSGDVPLELVWCPPGTFMMGGEMSAPQHKVRIAHGFWLGKFEVTKRQWQAVMGTTPWIEAGPDTFNSDLDSPAITLSWSDARAFIKALNAATGQAFRLPSEAEWEYGCRAGTTTQFYWGDDLDYTEIGDYAWYEGNTTGVDEPYEHGAGLKLPNAWGLYDMSGNAVEWCEDDWHDTYSGAPANGRAWVNFPFRAIPRVFRGGDWFDGAGYSASATRSGWGLNTSFVGTSGFRLAR